MVSIPTRYVTPEGYEIEQFSARTSGGLLYCEGKGQLGAPLVLLLHAHRSKASCSDWRDHIEILAAAGFRAVAVSFPGRGEEPRKSEGDPQPERTDCSLMPGGPVACVLDLLALLFAERTDEPRAALCGDGWGAAVALATAQYDPDRVNAVALLQSWVSHGRFPYEHCELAALEIPVAVLWAEAGSGDIEAQAEDAQPTEEMSLGLVKAFTKATYFKISKTPLTTIPLPRELPTLHHLTAPGNEGEQPTVATASEVATTTAAASISATSQSSASTSQTSNSEMMLRIGGWPNRKIFHAARGSRKYIGLAVAIVTAEDSADKAPTRAEATEYRARASALKKEVDQACHQDRQRYNCAHDLANFLFHNVLKPPETTWESIAEVGSSVNSLMLDVTAAAETLPPLSVRLPSQAPPRRLGHSSRGHTRARFFRHGLGLYGGQPPCEVDPRGMGAWSDRPWPLEVGQRVRASKSAASRQGSRAAVVKFTAKTAKVKTKKNKPPFNWSDPEVLQHQHVRRELELGLAPIGNDALVPATVVGVGQGGLRHTYTLEYDDGDIESSVHRLRIVGPGDPLADSFKVARPPSSFDSKVIETRLFPDGRRHHVSVRFVGSASAPPVLVLHGGSSESWSRDMRCLFEPLAHMGYRIIAPDLLGFGESPGERTPAANESRHGESGGPLEVRFGSVVCVCVHFFLVAHQKRVDQRHPLLNFRYWKMSFKRSGGVPARERPTCVRAPRRPTPALTSWDFTQALASR